MTNFNKIIIKKIFENKTRLTLMIINFTLGIFLFIFILSLGLNLNKNNKMLLKNSSHFKLVKIQINNNSNLEKIKSNSKISKIQLSRKSQFIVKKINNKEVLNNVYTTEISFFDDLLINDENLVLADNFSIYDGVIVSDEYVDFLELNKNDVLTKKIELSDGNEYIEKIIVGIFIRNKEDSFSPHLFFLNKSENFLADEAIIEVKSINYVQQVVEYLKDLGITHSSHLSEIKTLVSYSKLFFILSLIIGLLLLITSSTIITTSVIVSIKNKYYFLSLLKSIGYSNKQLSLFVIYEVLIVSTTSFIAGLILYFVAIFNFSKIINFNIIFKTQYVNVLSSNNLSIITTFIFLVLLSVIITIRPIKIINAYDAIKLSQGGVQ